MQSAARILAASHAALRTEERAAEIPSIGLGNEREYECLSCKDSGWWGIDLPGRSGMRECECAIEKARARYLALFQKALICCRPWSAAYPGRDYTGLQTEDQAESTAAWVTKTRQR